MNNINDLIVIKFIDNNKTVHELAVTPSFLISSESNCANLLKPIDFLSPQEIKEIKDWSVGVVLHLSKTWMKNSNILKQFINAVGLDLCVLLETLRTADIVLTKIIKKLNCKKIIILNESIVTNNMLQYESHGLQYLALLTNKKWCSVNNIEIIFEDMKLRKSNVNKKVFSPSLIRRTYFKTKGYYNLLTKLNLNLINLVLIKLKQKAPIIPKLVVQQNKDNQSLLTIKETIELVDYILLLNDNPTQREAFKKSILKNINDLFLNNDILDNVYSIYLDILKGRIQQFIKARTDLLIVYTKFKNLKNCKSVNLILPSAIGCGIDSWAALAIEENGGFIASTQHGSAYGNSYHPMMIFSDTRFDYFFTYSFHTTAPTYNFAKLNSKANWVTTGSCHLKRIKDAAFQFPTNVKKILYVMNLCVPFYSVNYPWEFITYQFKVLELLNLFGDKYEISVKKDVTNTVKEEDYPNLKFIKNSPSEVFEHYDLLLLESAISTVILEATVTNKFIVIMMGSEWEDCSSNSLKLLSKRAECFIDYSSYLTSLEKILINPSENLSIEKLDSLDFQNTYCNPVTTIEYNDTILKVVNNRIL